MCSPIQLFSPKDNKMTILMLWRFFFSFDSQEVLFYSPRHFHYTFGTECKNYTFGRVGVEEESLWLPLKDPISYNAWWFLIMQIGRDNTNFKERSDEKKSLFNKFISVGVAFILTKLLDIMQIFSLNYRYARNRFFLEI